MLPAASAVRARPSPTRCGSSSLAPAVQTAVRDGSISEGHARAIASVERAPEQEALLAAVVHRGLSVRQAEELARRLKQAPAQPDPAEPPADLDAAVRSDPEIERIETELRTLLGTKVSLTRSRKGGRIVIEYYDEADLNRLYEKLLGGVA